MAMSLDGGQGNLSQSIFCVCNQIPAGPLLLRVSSKAEPRQSFQFNIGSVRYGPGSHSYPHFAAKILDVDFRPSFWIYLRCTQPDLLSLASVFPEDPDPSRRLDRDGK